MAESDSFEVIQALRDGGDCFWNSISSLETAIVNALSCNNVADKQQTTTPKSSNLENSICNFIAQIFGLNTKVEGDADIIAQWKRNDLKQEPKIQGEDEVEIKVLVEKTRQNAINLYREISGGSETQQEINLITLLHAHRLKLIKEVLKEDSKSEEDKLKEIKDILENKGNFNPNFNLMDNIYCLTEVNFQPGNDLEWRSLLPEEPTPAKSPTNSSSIYPPQKRDSFILDKKTKEQLLFRLNDFGYSCLGVLESGANEISKIEALKALCQEESATDYAKEYSDLKSAIRKKIESGASAVYLELCKIDLNALNLTNLNYPEETEEERATCYDSYKKQLLDENISSIIRMATDKLRQTKREVGKFEEEEQVETKRLKSLLNSKAEIIAESGIKNGIDKMHYSLMAIDPLIDTIRTAMYNHAFIQISFAKGRELVEELGKIPGGDLAPPPSSEIQPRAQPAIQAPRRSHPSPNPLPASVERG